MKKEFQYLALGLLLVVIVSLLFGSSGPEPYSGSELFSKQYVYEGLEEGEVPESEKKKEEEIELPPVEPPVESMDNRDSKTSKEEQAPRSIVSSIANIFGKPEVKKPDNEHMSGLEQTYASTQGMFKLPNQTNEGFALTPAEYSAQPINDNFAAFADAYSYDANSASCISGCLSTSRGPLCLTPELIEILRTHGGNASSK